MLESENLDHKGRKRTLSREWETDFYLLSIVWPGSAYKSCVKRRQLSYFTTTQSAIQPLYIYSFNCSHSHELTKLLILLHISCPSIYLSNHTEISSYIHPYIHLCIYHTFLIHFSLISQPFIQHFTSSFVHTLMNFSTHPLFCSFFTHLSIKYPFVYPLFELFIESHWAIRHLTYFSVWYETLDTRKRAKPFLWNKSFSLVNVAFRMGKWERQQGRSSSASPVLVLDHNIRLIELIKEVGSEQKEMWAVFMLHREQILNVVNRWKTFKVS